MSINMNILNVMESDNEEYLRNHVHEFDFNQVLNSGYTVLEQFIISNSNKCLSYLLNYGYQPSIHSCLCAAMYGNDIGMKLVLEHGADPNIVDGEGWTPLHWAVQENFGNCVQLLLKNNANINALNDDGETPLYIAASDNNVELLELLLSQGAQVDLTKSTSPFQIACAFRCFDCCDSLLQHNANINFQDEDGRTALFYSVVKNDTITIQYLVDRNACFSIIDNWGYSIYDLQNDCLRQKLYYELFYDGIKYL